MATKFWNMKQNDYSSPNTYHRSNLKSLLGCMKDLHMDATSCVFKVQENVHPGIDIMYSDISAACTCMYCTTSLQ